MSHKERARKIAIVNQTVEAGNMTMEDYVLMGRMPYRSPFQFFDTPEDYAIAEENMRLTGTWNKKDKFMNRLSGGEQQLAAIARALTQKNQYPATGRAYSTPGYFPSNEGFEPNSAAKQRESPHRSAHYS